MCEPIKIRSLSSNANHYCDFHSKNSEIRNQPTLWASKGPNGQRFWSICASYGCKSAFGPCGPGGDVARQTCLNVTQYLPFL